MSVHFYQHREVVQFCHKVSKRHVVVINFCQVYIFILFFVTSQKTQMDSWTTDMMNLALKLKRKVKLLIYFA